MARMIINYLIVACVLLTIGACNDTRKSNTDKNTPIDSLPVVKGLDLEKNIALTDSLQVLFYNDPDGDSLRYSRFFEYSITRDQSTIQSLLTALDTIFTERSQVLSCRSEGKIYLFAKTDPLKTVYFSTRGDSCSYLYFIRNGLFYYFSLPSHFRERLNEIRKQKREPETIDIN